MHRKPRPAEGGGAQEHPALSSRACRVRRPSRQLKKGEDQRADARRQIGLRAGLLEASDKGREENDEGADREHGARRIGHGVAKG